MFVSNCSVSYPPILWRERLHSLTLGESPSFLVNDFVESLQVWNLGFEVNGHVVLYSLANSDKKIVSNLLHKTTVNDAVVRIIC